MTTRRKKAERKGSAKAKKLALNKETLKDLTLASEKGHNVRGGNKRECSLDATGC